MAKSAKQKAETEKVQQRLTSDTPLRLDVSAAKSGGERGHTLTESGIHPSLESVTERMTGLGVESGTVTTSSGMSVEVTKGPRAKAYAPHGQGLAPQQGKTPLPPVEQGVSQRYSQQIGREHGHAKAAELTAEADALAAKPNPLRSDGHVDMLVALHGPSVGGNTHGLGGGLSSLAKHGNANLTPDEGHTYAAHQLGYGEGVQQEMFKAARDRVQRRQGRGMSPALSEAEINSRAYGQVNEHLDEAVHGTKEVGKGGSLVNSLIADLGSAQESGGSGFGVYRESPGEGAAPARTGPTPTGPGMTKSRTPLVRAQREAVKTLVSQKGGWAALQDADAHTQAAADHLKVLTLRQQARRAGAVAPEERLTDSPGAQPEQKARSLAQPVFSTGAHPEAKTAKGEPVTSVLPAGVGVPSEQAAAMGRRAAKVRRGQTVTRASATATPRAPGRAQPGEISPIPTSLPTEPARLGRTREERGLGPRDYTPDIKAYEEGRPKISAKTGGAVDVKAGLKQDILKETSKGRPTGVPTVTDKNRRVNKVEESNVAVAQTALDPAGLTAARKQNPSLGQRAAQGARSKRPTVR